MGRREGGLKAAAKIKAYYGDDYYARIGKLGGTKSRGGGFTGNPEAARRAGKLGGRPKGSVGAAKRVRPGAYKWVEDKPNAADETLFIDDSTEFGDDFFRPTLKQRMLNKIRSL